MSDLIKKSLFPKGFIKHKIKTSGSLEVTFIKKGLLPDGGISMTFADVEAGVQVTHDMKALLDAGIVPPEIQEKIDDRGKTGRARVSRSALQMIEERRQLDMIMNKRPTQREQYQTFVSGSVENVTFGSVADNLLNEEGGNRMNLPSPDICRIIRVLCDGPTNTRGLRNGVTSEMCPRLRREKLSKVNNVAWAYDFIQYHKIDLLQSKSTIIKKRVAISLVIDHAIRMGHPIVNHLKTISPKAMQFSDEDIAAITARIEELDLGHKIRAKDRLGRDGREVRCLPADEAKVIKTFDQWISKPPALFAKPDDSARYAQMKSAFILAVETMMRMSEIHSLTWGQVHLIKRKGASHISLDFTKNGDSRLVPLSSRAVEVLEALYGLQRHDSGVVFYTLHDDPHELIKAQETGPKARAAYNTKLTDKVSKWFRRLFDDSGFPELHFHDLRHEATSRLFEHTSMPKEMIKKMGGWRSERSLDRYTNLRAEAMGSFLD